MKKTKSLALILALVMALCIMPVMVSAEQVEVNVTYNAETGEYVATGVATAGAEVSMLAFRTASALLTGAPVEEVPDLETGDITTDNITYIDQQTADGDGNVKFSFKLRQLEADNASGAQTGTNITVFMGSTVASLGWNDYAIEYAAGAMTPNAYPTGYDYFIDGVGFVTFTLTESADQAGWADGAEVTVVDADGEPLESTVSATLAERTITFDSDDFTDGVLSFKLKATMTGYQDYTTSAYTVKTKLAATLDKLTTAQKTVSVEYDDEDVDFGADKVQITVPAADENLITGCEIVYEVEVDGAADETGVGGVYTLDRPAEDAAEDMIVDVYLVIMDGAFELGRQKIGSSPYTIRPVGAEPTEVVAAEDITVKTASDARFGGSIAEVDPADVEGFDPEEDTLTVGGKALFYSPQRNMMIGVVTETDTEQLSGGAEVTKGTAASQIFYGKGNNPFSNTAVTALDANVAISIALRLTDLSDKDAVTKEAILMVCDVDGGGSVTAIDANQIIAVALRMPGAGLGILGN